MASIVMKMNGCDLAHEMNYTNLKLHSSGKDIAKPDKPVRAGKAVAAALEEATDKITVLSSAFPKCP